MRPILSLLVCFLSFFALAQNQQTGRVKLVTVDSRDGRWIPPYSSYKVTFYKIHETSPFLRINTRNYSGLSVELESIPAGEYEMHYINIYKQEIAKHVLVQDNSITDIFLFPDSLDSYPQHTLTKLTGDDSLVINFESSGCFSHESARILIKRVNDQLVARLNNLTSISSDGTKGPDDVLSVVLTEKNINDFTRFENELIYAGEGGCTTTDEYEITSPYLNIKTIDGGCRWNGFYFLLKSIFGKINTDKK